MPDDEENKIRDKPTAHCVDGAMDGHEEFVPVAPAESYGLTAPGASPTELIPPPDILVSMPAFGNKKFRYSRMEIYQQTKKDKNIWFYVPAPEMA